MKTLLSLTTLIAAVMSSPAAAQQADVHRQVYTFIDNRLDLLVVADAPGVVQIVRGERGRIEVASRTTDGIAGSGLGGTLTRQLRLSAAGASGVEYLVSVPEHVSVRVHLPAGGRAGLSPSTGSATYRWGDDVMYPRHPVPPAAPAPHGPELPPAAAPAAPPPAAPGVPPAAPGIRPPMPGTPAPAPAPVAPLPAAPPPPPTGPFLIHVTPWAPAVVDVVDLSAVRSLAVRFEGGEFRVVSSRPLAVEPGTGGRMELHVGGEPLDLILYVPRQGPAFSLRSGSLRLAEAVGGRAQALCGNVVVQHPTAEQTWFTFHPQAGRLDCR